MPEPSGSSSSRRRSLRVPHRRSGGGSTSSRTPSVRSSSHRSSAVLDDARHPAAGTPAAPVPVPVPAPGVAHSLRAPSSRFSLHNEFAATRQEYSLWDDDASSIFERVTVASGGADDADDNDRFLVGSVDGFGLVSKPHDDTFGPIGRSSHDDPDWDYYDVLCLPRNVAGGLSQDQIRRAHHRLFLLFYPDSYPEHLRPVARQQFLRAQEAFEALIDPARRARYDLDVFLHLDRPEDPSWASYEAAFRDAVRDRLRNGVQTSSDLGLRLDATKLRDRDGRFKWKQWQSGAPPLKLLDFALSQSVSVDLPALRNLLQPQVSRFERLTTSAERKEAEAEGFPQQAAIEACTPTLTVLGSVYGVTGDLSLMPTALLYDRYQPLLPLTIPRRRLIQLVENKLSPLAALRYRQEFVNHAPPPPEDKSQWIKTAFEIESELLPEVCVTSRLYHHVLLPDCAEPTVFETSVQASRHHPRTPPRVTVGMHHGLFNGTAFARADSGNWVLGPGWLKMKHHVFGADGPLETAPGLELGFRSGPPERVPAPDSPHNDKGIRGLDSEVETCEDGTWAVSAAATPGSVRGFVRYSKDLSLPRRDDPASARVEVELCSSTFRDRYLALRNLWSVGRFARLGLEVGVSPHSLHVSVYWSRLGQRLSVPLLVAPQAVLSPEVFLWAGALPFTGLAAVQLLLHHRRSSSRSSDSDSGTGRRRRRASSPGATARAVARNRNEADSVTVLLAGPIEARQKRQSSLGGLVIQSAKYGVPDADKNLAGELVADVTIALAALIDDSSSNTAPCLVLPGSVRKSRIPGFWDPAPGRDKTLRVHYSFRGVEDVVDVRGRAELVLPPPPPPPSKS
ncbi:hypothetical protein B0J13DRAFT_545416 [Dactylonectria estremocensis]|uniref:J domain-containing protein n=1 Tax=Dactylonectria estremocensis TaxID=1079267 RepID=A0A9P9JCA4_9HYPO|nr:hypothetical protein B0J13DRAFT_545416 [Dactylonectria estremocensis]